jgi:hypothetical protein
MVLKITSLIRQQEGVRHVLKVKWEKPLQPAYNNTKYVLLREMVHQRIPIENAFIVPPYDIQVLIPQSQPIPHDVTLTQPGTFPVATFPNNILDSI